MRQYSALFASCHCNLTTNTDYALEEEELRKSGHSLGLNEAVHWPCSPSSHLSVPLASLSSLVRHSADCVCVVLW